ncbi:hypothetical protein KUTeg_000181, partial [Tegillarca granosa]
MKPHVISEPTHFTENSASLLDLIIVNDKDLVVYSEVGEMIFNKNIRYHCPNKIWLYDQGNYDLFREKLGETVWNTILESNDLETACFKITNAILNCASICIPNKTVTIRPLDPPWINGGIRKLIRKRRRLHRRAKHSDNPTHWAQFRKIRNKYVNTIKKSRDKYFKSLASKLQNKNLDAKQWWKITKQMCGVSCGTLSPPSLLVNDKMYSDPNYVTNIFHDYFSSQSTIDDTLSTVPHLQTSIHPILDNKLLLQMISLDITKAVGPDSINPRTLREGSE